MEIIGAWTLFLHVNLVLKVVQNHSPNPNQNQNLSVELLMMLLMGILNAMKTRKNLKISLMMVVFANMMNMEITTAKDHQMMIQVQVQMIAILIQMVTPNVTTNKLMMDLEIIPITLKKKATGNTVGTTEASAIVISVIQS